MKRVAALVMALLMFLSGGAWKTEILASEPEIPAQAAAAVADAAREFDS